MRKLWFPLLVVLLCFSANAFASCPTPPAGPYTIGFHTYADYTQDELCYSTNNVSPASTNCGSLSAWSFGTGTGSASASFLIGPTDWVGNTSNWEIDTYVDFSSPGGTVSDRFEIDVDVEHSNHTVSHYTVLFHSGLLGSLSSCTLQSINFTADHGDTVTVSISTNKTSSGNIVISVPKIFSNYP